MTKHKKMSIKERQWMERVDILRERCQAYNDTIRNLNKAIYSLTAAADCCTECSL